MSTNGSERLDAYLELKRATEEWQALGPVFECAVELYNLRVAQGIHTKQEEAAKCEVYNAANELTRAQSNSPGLELMTLREVTQMREVLCRGTDAIKRFISAVETASTEASSPPPVAEKKGLSESEAYGLLGVPPDCTDKELNVAYHKKTAYWHPDKFHSMDIPKEMKEIATREMARANDAYAILTKLRSASNLSTAVENPLRDASNQHVPQSSARGKEVAQTQVPPSILIKRLEDMNKSMEEANRNLKKAFDLVNYHLAKRNPDQSSANPKKVTSQQYLDEDCHKADSESHDQSMGELMPNEENPSYRPRASNLTEQEKFYRKLNQVADEHSTEIQLGLAYGKYRFWKAIFNSKPGQFIVLLILAGICWIFGSDYSARIILATVITLIVWMILTIGGAIAGGKNPGGERQRTKVGLVPTLFIWVVVFLFLTFVLNKSPEEVAPNTQPVTQETKPAQAPVPRTSTLQEPTPSDPATASPSDELQAVEPSPAAETDKNASLGATLPSGNVDDSNSPAEKTEKGFQACVRFSGPAYEDCMKPYR